MNTILKIEEALMFAGCLFLYPYLNMSWWYFAAFILIPDISMIGYAVNPQTGAFSYNLFHHKGVALAIGLTGFYFNVPPLEFAGLILFAHASMDRMLGYGLKYKRGFRYTHLGEIGHPER